MSANRIGKPGCPAPHQTETSSGWNSQSGATSTTVFKGNEAECQRQARIAISTGATDIQSRSLGDGNFELRVTYPVGLSFWPGSNGQPDAPTNSHELEVDSMQPDLWKSPVLLDTLSEESIAVVADCLNQWERGDYNGGGTTTTQSKAETDLYAQLILAGKAAEQPEAVALFRLTAYAKAKGYDEEHYVYRRTITVSNPQQVKVSFTGCGKIWTTAEVLAFEKPPQSYYFALPTAVWFKSKPRLITVFGQKAQIQYHYREAVAVSSLLYDKYGAANESTDYLWTP